MLSYIKLVKPEPEPTTKPPIFNVDNTVALLVVKLYELTSYIPALFQVIHYQKPFISFTK